MGYLYQAIPPGYCSNLKRYTGRKGHKKTEGFAASGPRGLRPSGPRPQANPRCFRASGVGPSKRAVIAAGGEVAETVEEVLGGLELLLDRGLAADVVGDRALLRLGEVGEVLLETALGFGVEPVEALGDDRSVLGGLVVRRADPLIDEGLDPELRGQLVARIVRRQDQVGQRCGGLALLRGQRERPKIARDVVLVQQRVPTDTLASGRGRRRSQPVLSRGMRKHRGGRGGGSDPLERLAAVDLAGIICGNVFHVRRH